MKMKVNGRHAVNSYSSRGSGSACFWRRRYALEPPSVAPNGTSRGGVAGGRGGGGGGGHQNVTWGDQLVHYLDDEEARGFARRSPFGAAGVARPLTSEECWRGRGTQLPRDGNLFLPPSRRESRREDLAAQAAAVAGAAAAAAAASSVAVVPTSDNSGQSSPTSGDKCLSLVTVSSSVKQEEGSFRGGGGLVGANEGGGGGWVGGSGKVAPGARNRYVGGGGGGAQDARGPAVHNTVWAGGGNGGNEMYAMNGGVGGGGGNGHGGDVAGIRASMPSPPDSRQVGGEGGPGSNVAFWETKKGMEAHHQQAAAAALNSGGFADDIGGLGEGIGKAEKKEGGVGIREGRDEGDASVVCTRILYFANAVRQKRVT